MSKLEELIQQYCPDGVKYIKVGDFCEVFTGGEAPVRSIKSKEPIGDCVFPIYSNGIGENALWGYSNTYKINRKAITFSSIGTIGHPEIREPNFTPIIRLKTIIPDEDIMIIGFLKYCLEIVDFTSQKSSVPNINSKMIKELEVPLPALPVQREIVRLLDEFSLLSAELAAELAARKQQYEFYRDQLLMFDESVQEKSLSDILRIRNGKDYKKFKQGEYPVYGTGGIMARIDRYAYNKPSVLIPRKGSLDKLYYVDEPFWTVDTIFYTEIDENHVIPKYVFYYLQTKHLEDLNEAGGVPSLTQTVLNKVKIHVPEIEKQIKIINSLDKFSAIVDDVSSGLPAEIEARQKQYEYYRDKLLSFKRLDA